MGGKRQSVLNASANFPNPVSFNIKKGIRNKESTQNNHWNQNRNTTR